MHFVLYVVILGLDPGIHLSAKASMDAAIKCGMTLS